MKNITMKNIIKVSSLFIALVVSSTALASQRYIVIYKSKQGYAAMNKYMMMEGVSSLKLENSLNHIQAQVVRSAKPAAIEALKNHPEVALIESETFSPAPRPVNGLKLFRAHSMTAGASNEDQLPVDQLPTDPVQSPDNQDNSLVQVPVFQAGDATPWGIIAVNAAEAWEASKAGANARVLVLDTGIDPQHPALKANFEKGRNFFENFDGPNPEDFIDTNGHGTHCAGTIAASYNEQTGFTGVAPLAKILAGRVCGELGCSNIAVAEGINWGVEQKVDVISMSLGGPRTSSAERLAVANAEKAGVTVVAASGNGGNPSVSFPAALPTVIAVGAVDSTITKTAFSQWGPELDIVAPGAGVISSVPRGSARDAVTEITVNGSQKRIKSVAFLGTKLFPTPRVGELVPAGLGQNEDFAKVDVAGKIALISRGVIPFADKVANALRAKAIGVVIYNNTSGLSQGSLTQDNTEIDAAVVMIEQATGQELLNAITAGEKVTAGISTVASDYAMFDGTSMATPHVAGVVALIKSANKKLTPVQVRTVLASTARALGPNTNNEYGKGLVQADKAVQMSLSEQ